MSVKETFLSLLSKSGYKNVNASRENDFDKKLEILELDRENVFHAMYGDKIIENRGMKPTKEWLYRFGEALEDMKANYIKITIHYLIMQIKIGAIKL